MPYRLTDHKFRHGYYFKKKNFNWVKDIQGKARDALKANFINRVEQFTQEEGLNISNELVDEM